MGGQTLEVRHFTCQAKQTSLCCHLIVPNAEKKHRSIGEASDQKRANKKKAKNDCKSVQIFSNS